MVIACSSLSLRSAARPGYGPRGLEVSTYSAASGNCIQISGLPRGHRAVSDSESTISPNLIFTVAGWQAFTTSVRTGQFDSLATQRCPGRVPRPRCGTGRYRRSSIG